MSKSLISISIVCRITLAKEYFMTGNNSIRFNVATMVTAVQYYLDNVAFRKKVNVVSVKGDNINGFEVNFEESQEETINHTETLSPELVRIEEKLDSLIARLPPLEADGHI